MRIRDLFRMEGWKGFIIPFLIFFVIGLGFWTVIDRLSARGSAVHSEAPIVEPRIRLMMNNVQEERHHREAVFVSRFKNGDFGYFPPHYKFSKAYKAAFLYKAHQRWVKKYPNQPWNAYKTWDTFTTTDSCNGPTVDSPNCHWAGGPNLQSPYWTRREATQDKWEMRVFFCGASVVAAYYLGGTLKAATANSGGFCMASFFVH